MCRKWVPSRSINSAPVASVADGKPPDDTSADRKVGDRAVRVERLVVKGVPPTLRRMRSRPLGRGGGSAAPDAAAPAALAGGAGGDSPRQPSSPPSLSPAASMPAAARGARPRPRTGRGRPPRDARGGRRGREKLWGEGDRTGWEGGKKQRGGEAGEGGPAGVRPRRGRPARQCAGHAAITSGRTGPRCTRTTRCILPGHRLPPRPRWSYGRVPRVEHTRREVLWRCVRCATSVAGPTGWNGFPPIRITPRVSPSFEISQP